ncbi:hypothetical protein CLV28_0083 [Sediminihabitans luteus]|uniref:Uncharacterized protein n=1 Tax=Sediminihabitans luteus TaxID=1138585 RepID=A0A2M9CYF4_9CELL|nr:hypothetical protein [Sediminihabitans luteus]PJJ76875.1 hypothetical protein CLV28_0083 [Sediminihabitans luteus]
MHPGTTYDIAVLERRLQLEELAHRREALRRLGDRAPARTRRGLLPRRGA